MNAMTAAVTAGQTANETKVTVKHLDLFYGSFQAYRTAV